MFKEGQGVERRTYVGADPRKAAFVMLANYLSAAGRLGEFEWRWSEQRSARKGIGF